MKRKILFFIESLGGGGAEKVLSTIVRHLDKKRFDVTVCVVSAGGKYDDEVASYVHVCSLLRPQDVCGWKRICYWCKYQMIYNWLPKRWVYKLFVPQGYDVEVAFVEGFATKVLSYSTNLNAKKIAWVHVDLKQRSWPIQMGIYKDVEEERASYCRYNQVVCVSHSVEKVMREVYDLDYIIPNHQPHVLFSPAGASVSNNCGNH